MKSMRISKMIRDLSDSEQGALLALLSENNLSYSALGNRSFGTEEELRVIVGSVAMGGRDPEAFLNEWIGRMRAQTLPEPTRTESGPGLSANAGQRSTRERLAELGELLAMGIISADEYDLKRQQVIDSI